MIDQKKVIKAWEIFRDSNPYGICEGKEFIAINEPEYCMSQMIEDTITLLKEQPEIVRCKNCRSNHQCAIQFKFADADDEENWFCADGKRR